MKNLRQLFIQTRGAEFFGDAEVVPANLIADSRRVVPGALFFARAGIHNDGSDFALDAVKRGAVAVVAKERIALPATIPQVIVPDVSCAIATVAEAFWDDPADALSLVGVTGTNGKTSVTSIVRYLMMRQKGAQSWGLIGTVRYELGRRSIPSYKTTPESLDLIALLAEMRDAGCAGAVMEVSSHAIDQNRVFALPFDVVAFTNLTQDHIDYHGDMETYFSVKSRLFDGSQGAFPRVAVVNTDDAYGRRLLEKIPSKTLAVPFGFSDKSIAQKGGYFAGDIVLSAEGSRFVLHSPAGTFDVATALPGDYNVSNVLCALAITGSIGGNLEQAICDLPGFRGVHGRMERVPNPFPFSVFVDYAHTDDALSNALRMLKRIAKRRVLAVFGCGGNRDRGKRPKMVRAVQAIADFAWATSDNPRKEPLGQIFSDMQTGVVAPDKISFIADRRRAIGLALDAAEDGDIVLIAGKGHETYQEFADVTLPFDDCAVARELLELRSHRLSQ